MPRKATRVEVHTWFERDRLHVLAELPDEPCSLCHAPAVELSCECCAATAVVTNCGHHPQPRPIAPDTDGALLCGDCWSLG